MRGADRPRGHAIELRLYAEDPVDVPAALGRDRSSTAEPARPGRPRRLGRRARAARVGVEYDPLLAKLIVSAPDREAAIARARRALGGVGRPRRRDEPAAARGRARLAGVSLRPLRDGPRRRAFPRPVRRSRPTPPGSPRRARSRRRRRRSSRVSAGAAAGGPDPWDEALAGWRLGAREDSSPAAACADVRLSAEAAIARRGAPPRACRAETGAAGGALDDRTARGIACAPSRRRATASSSGATATSRVRARGRRASSGRRASDGGSAGADARPHPHASSSRTGRRVSRGQRPARSRGHEDGARDPGAAGRHRAPAAHREGDLVEAGAELVELS